MKYLNSDAVCLSQNFLITIFNVKLLILTYYKSSLSSGMKSDYLDWLLINFNSKYNDCWFDFNKRLESFLCKYLVQIPECLLDSWQQESNIWFHKLKNSIHLVFTLSILPKAIVERFKLIMITQISALFLQHCLILQIIAIFGKLS